MTNVFSFIVDIYTGFFFFNLKKIWAISSLQVMLP